MNPPKLIFDNSWEGERGETERKGESAHASSEHYRSQDTRDGKKWKKDDTIATRVLELPGKWKHLTKRSEEEGEYVSGICDMENGVRRRERKSKSEDIEESDSRRESFRRRASKSENRGIRLCPRFLRPWDAEIYENSGFNSDLNVILSFKRAWLIHGNYVEVLGVCRSPGKRRIY